MPNYSVPAPNPYAAPPPLEHAPLPPTHLSHIPGPARLPPPLTMAEDPLVTAFNVYMQIVVSQALEPGFLSAIREEKGTQNSFLILLIRY